MYDFGANINDRINYTGLPVALFNANRTSLVCCWVRPTTLTANRAIWAQSANSALVVDTTTSNATLIVDTATVDGNYRAPVGMAVNTMTFIAFLWSLGGTGVSAVRAWSATESTGPVEQTVTVASTPTGAYVGGGTGFTVGNILAGGAAFQGAVGGAAVFGDSTNSNLNAICGIAAAGAITQAQADAVRAAFVDPCWRGDILRLAGAGRQVYNTSGFGFAMACSLDQSIAGNAWALMSNAPPQNGAVTSATVSTFRSPHSFDDNKGNLWNARRSGFLVRT